ncbi:hypothetical protein [uncultured Sphingopyxis sp.]|uniref:hypothetical protein n=1 Tax=uncultured Sphingopyxis sp. TaxID=310581 RepID=UPI0025CBE2EE|nr:hypothetical protein [uncultured Sphingopyxis sp.]
MILQVASKQIIDLPSAIWVSRMLNPLELLDLVEEGIRHRSGAVFYSGRAAFSRPSPLYVLGLNPGGSPTKQADETIQRDINSYSDPSKEYWSRYADESWRGRAPGTYGMQPRVLHLLSSLGFDPRTVPASNVVFVRTPREASLEGEKLALLEACWPVHHAVIQHLRINTLLCFGGTSGRWVREALGAHELVDIFTEENSRRWTSSAHLNSTGLCVITATHPSIANWRNPAADPTSLVRRMLLRRW